MKGSLITCPMHSQAITGFPRAGACGSAFQIFDLSGLNHRCEITPGVLAAESLTLLKDFSLERRTETISKPEA